jgi:hypothetical protein
VEEAERAAGLSWSELEVQERASIPTGAMRTPGAVDHLIRCVEWALERLGQNGLATINQTGLSAADDAPVELGLRA